MIEILLATLGLLALLLYGEWRSRRDRHEAAAELARSRAETVAARAELTEERERAAEERRELYQRIQAPEVAVADAALEKRRETPYVPRKPIGADDDAAFAARSEARRAKRASERAAEGEVEGG
jgi:FtsZ-interacting cell division protein ZipA